MSRCRSRETSQEAITKIQGRTSSVRIEIITVEVMRSDGVLEYIMKVERASRIY